MKLPIAKLMDTAYIFITYWKMGTKRLGTSEGSILNVHPSEGFSILISFIRKKACSQK
jgi:hypothetical protein